MLAKSNNRIKVLNAEENQDKTFEKITNIIFKYIK